MRKLIFIIALFSTVLVFGQNQIQVNTAVERRMMKLGEQTTLSLKVLLPESLREILVSFPEIDKNIRAERADTNLISNLEVIDSYVDTLTDINTGLLGYQKNFIITSWDTGVFMIDSLEVLIGDSMYRSNATSIKIDDVPVDTTKDIVDIKEIYTEESSEKEEEAGESWLSKNWLWLTIVFVLLITGVLGWFFYFRKKQEVIEVKAKLPAHQIALQKLSSLKKKDYIKRGMDKEYYSEITEIIRVYLEDRFDVKALELTTHEIINRLKYTNISPDNKFSLKEVLETADLVKFAKMKPSEMDNENTLFKAEEFVRQTKMKPIETEESEDDSVA